MSLFFRTFISLLDFISTVWGLRYYCSWPWWSNPLHRSLSLWRITTHYTGMQGYCVTSGLLQFILLIFFQASNFQQPECGDVELGMLRFNCLAWIRTLAHGFSGRRLFHDGGTISLPYLLYQFSIFYFIPGIHNPTSYVSQGYGFCISYYM